MSTLDFEKTLEWANEFKPEPVISFSGPNILLIVAGIMITLLLVWWVVLIFSNPSSQFSTPSTQTLPKEEYVEYVEVIETVPDNSIPVSE